MGWYNINIGAKSIKKILYKFQCLPILSDNGLKNFKNYTRNHENLDQIWGYIFLCDSKKCEKNTCDCCICHKSSSVGRPEIKF